MDQVFQLLHRALEIGIAAGRGRQPYLLDRRSQRAGR
jgi:hypothetical protein